MKKRIALIVAALTAMLSMSAFADESKVAIDNFNSIEWGTDKETVEKTVVDSSMKEGTDWGWVDDGYTLVIVEGSVAGYDCNVFYNFDDSGFQCGMYMLSEKHSNEQQYYKDYESLVEKYKKKYGDSETAWLWDNDLYKGKSGKEGMAIICGDLRLFTRWTDSDGNQITAMASGDNYKPSVFIRYESAEYETPENNDGI